MTITTEQTRAMQDLYNEQVAIEGLNDPFTMSNHFRWEVWMARGFTQADLALVIRYIRYRIRQGRREKESLLLRNLISNPDEFSSNLSMARSWSRAPRGYTDKTQVLKATGRAVQVKDTVKSTEQIMRESEAFRKFREAGERL